MRATITRGYARVITRLNLKILLPSPSRRERLRRSIDREADHLCPVALSAGNRNALFNPPNEHELPAPESMFPARPRLRRAPMSL